LPGSRENSSGSHQIGQTPGSNGVVYTASSNKKSTYNSENGIINLGQVNQQKLQASKSSIDTKPNAGSQERKTSTEIKVTPKIDDSIVVERE